MADKDNNKTQTLTDKIGRNLHYANAKEIFGDNAVKAIQTVGEIAGHGFFKEEEVTSSLFGGFVLPKDDATLAKINTALNKLK